MKKSSNENFSICVKICSFEFGYFVTCLVFDTIERVRVFAVQTAGWRDRFCFDSVLGSLV